MIKLQTFRLNRRHINSIAFYRILWDMIPKTQKMISIFPVCSSSCIKFGGHQ